MGYKGFLQAEKFQPEPPLCVPTLPIRPMCDVRWSQRQKDLGQKLRSETVQFKSMLFKDQMYLHMENIATLLT